MKHIKDAVEDFMKGMRVMGTPGVNKVILVGSLGFNPEMKTAQTGLQIAKMRVATLHSYFDRTKEERQEVTEWHNVVAFGKLAELCPKILQKGAMAYIEGRIKTRMYEKDGEKRYFTEIIAEKIISLSRPPKQEEVFDESWKPEETPTDEALPF